ncbi:ATP dependent DEAD-box helicase [Strigomonas culicis]|uniref:ATP-dependent RNA helicase n=1 Tax=Strigomonas culicis TaxID=28005 RepID=S9UDM6_9TRYP|nr:ATP dependent DEAD-box helicase [Strigomonas culicis]|eukprot:EPY27023.1 ATP dependent DEAD-box helicase [Strigomonas culicis]
MHTLKGGAAYAASAVISRRWRGSVLPDPCARATLCWSRRHIIQSNRGPVRSILDQYETRQLVSKLRRNKNGNYYRYQQKLWPTMEQMEMELTKLHYSAVERTPYALLPMRKQAPERLASFEGPGATALLERAVDERSAAPSDHPPSVAVGPLAEEEVDDALLAVLAREADAPLSDKILSEKDLDGSMLASAKEQVRAVIQADLEVNTLMAARPHPAAVGSTRAAPSARDLAGTTWADLGLDAALEAAATAYLGPTPSRLQSRLLPALLNEDHNDVLLNGVTGSGKTTALVLAALQGVRGETAGMNLLVASNTTTAMRMHDTVRALCRRAGGGALVDRPANDYSWLFLGTFREDYENYYRLLRRGLHGPHGPARLFITTADVLCELLFQKKMEFADYGYLRRVYVDDVGTQVPMLEDSASTAEVRERVRNPLAAELLLGTLHQLPGPHIRSVLQLGLVSADVDGRLKKHLKALCLKPTAHTIVMSPVRLPTTITCFFSFYLVGQSRFEYMVQLVRNARATIPGRAVLFIRDTEDMLHVRQQLRGHGMDAKIFSEVYANGAFKDQWKFLVLKESEAFGIDLPHVSHVFITFTPRSWQTYLHMCGRTGRLGNLGWVYTITDKREAPQVRQIAEDLQVEFTHHVVAQDLSQVHPRDVQRQTKEPDLYGLDPQYVVKQHYEVQTENPDMAYRPREFFSKPNVVRQFQMEDYTPTAEKQRSFVNATKLAHDVERDPRVVLEMKEKGLLTDRLKPTQKLKNAMRAKSYKWAPSPFGKEKGRK